jgi:glycosyltransferase involved in cell wall biosynthesis
MNNAIPKISIITPSFNQGGYLEETILSVINQNYSNYELLIIDAGSTDSTLDVIRKYEQHITYWVSEPDRGQSHAIQKGLEKATGDIINWINSDDLLAPGALHNIAKEFDLDKYDVLCGYCDYFVNDLEHLDKRNERMWLGPSVGHTLVACHINQPSTFFKAAILKSLGIDEQYRYTMDVDLWYRYLLSAGMNKIKLSDKLLTYFRLHQSSKSVAEGSLFMGDNYKVFYNVLYSSNQHPVLLEFMKQKVSAFEQYKPTRYLVNVTDLQAFVRHHAWLAVHYYNEIHNYNAARICLDIARSNGQPLDITLFRQMIKHYLIPSALLRRM